MYFKLPKGKEVVEVNDKNTINLYERNGFVKCDAKGKLKEEVKTDSIEE